MVVETGLSQLNQAQHAAVTAQDPHLLIVAGAGSGKTRVLTQRIAWLVQHCGLSPYAILAVTFTNKAAAEMRHRVESVLNMPIQGVWLGTFHSIAHRLLRLHREAAGLPENFQVLDSDDQLRLVKRIMQKMGLDEKRWPYRQAQNFINSKKDEALRPENIPTFDRYSETQVAIYQDYEQVCRQAGVIDFAELLLRAYELWQQHPDLLEHYQQRFAHILVDEFQDTNTIQYRWLHLLAHGGGHYTAVGDDDQSIYGWRGAKIENIQRFSADFPNTKVIRLEQNYRSTGNILAAANAVINCNQQRLGKNLWTDMGNGELISVYAAFNERDEARFIIERIRTMQAEDYRYRDMAILYRSNAQSRVLEESLIQYGIPYRIYGGLRFFERAEIKDTLAYLRLVANPNDDTAFERVVNVPARSLGDKTLESIRLYANNQQCSLWQASQEMLQQNQFAARAHSALNGFCELIIHLAHFCESKHLGEQTDYVITHSGLRAHYQKEGVEKSTMRLENLDEMVNAAREFENALEELDANITPLTMFLTHAALEAGEQQHEGQDNAVQLMTLHAAKGLEFPVVFLCGLEEGLFPHRLTQEDINQLAEERRLCYVGITRAMKKLFLSYAETRRMYGGETLQRPSRFLYEIPSDLVQELRVKTQVTRPQLATKQTRVSTSSDYNGLTIGQRVNHHVFGEGTILNIEGNGTNALIQVKFKQGTKLLMAAQAKLQPV